MPTIEIEPREGKGSSNSRRLRSQGLIPSIVYHRGEESVDGSLSYKEFVRVASQSTSSQVFMLKSSDKRLDGRTCLVKDIQKDFLKNKVLHVDLQSLKDDEEITVRIPVHVKGDATGVKNEGGILSVAIHDLGVACLPRQIPKQITIDVTELALGKSIHAADVELPAGVKLIDDPEETIVSVIAVRVVEEAPVAEAAEPAAEGGEAAPAAADAKAAAPAAGAEKDKKK